MRHRGGVSRPDDRNAYLGAVDLERVLVLDPVNDEMKTALEAWSANHLVLVAGF